MNVTLDETAKPPVFRFHEPSGGPSRVLQIRVTEVGVSDPSWLVLPIGSYLEDAAVTHILTPEEAERTNLLGSFDFDGELGAAASAFGIPVSSVTYGLVPAGFKQEGPLLPLEPNRLYQLLVLGATVGELEFYG